MDTSLGNVDLDLFKFKIMILGGRVRPRWEVKFLLKIIYREKSFKMFLSGNDWQEKLELVLKHFQIVLLYICFTRDLREKVRALTGAMK